MHRPGGVASESVPPSGTRAIAPARPPDPPRAEPGVAVRDVIYLAASLALVALVALIAKTVEKL